MMNAEKFAGDRKDISMTAENYTFYNQEAGEAFRTLSKDGMLAVFLYSCHIYRNGEAVPCDPADPKQRTIAISGVMMVPSCFFASLPETGWTAEGDTGYLRAGDRLFRFAENGTEVLTDGGVHTLSAPAVRRDSVWYLPVLDTAHLLGYAAKRYYDNRLAVVGSPAHIAAMDAGEGLAEAGAYLVLGPYDPSRFTEEDYRAARLNWRLKLVGSPAMNDLSDSTIAEKIGYVSRTCREKWETMNRGPDRVILWGAEAPVESVELNRQYGGLRTLAKGWGTCGSEFYHNEALLQDIVDGVRWMYAHMYGEAEIAGTGWRDVRAFNWYYWFIDAPDFLTDIFFILEDPELGCDPFTLEEKRTYLKCFAWISTFMRSGLRRDFAMSRICVCTKAAIALCDSRRLYEEYVDFDMLLALGETGEGPRVDYVQWTHGFPYNIGYGRLNLDRVLYTASALAGTPLEMNSPRQYTLFLLAKYMFEPALYRGQGMVMLNGRNTRLNEMANGGACFAYMLDMLGMFGEDEDLYIRRMVRRHAETEGLAGSIKGSGSIRTCTILDDIMADDTMRTEESYEYAHAWFTGDRAVQQRNNYAVGIAMTSRREFAYESINDANKTGWYTGDGAVYLYTDYDSHPFDGRNFLLSNPEVAYHFPGTTEDERERVVRSIRSDKVWRPSTDFAGSLQFRDRFLVCAMDFESLNCPGPDENLTDTGYGGSQPVHINDLRAKKAWFCFDNEIIALGAGITSSMDSPVNTTVEHRRLVREEEFGQYIRSGGETERLEREVYVRTGKDPSWVLMEGHAGYVFPCGGEVLVRRYVCAESGGQPFMEIRLCHGVNPSDASYVYGILPYADAGLLDRYAQDPDVEVLANTSALQAVREKTLGITGYVFHQAGTCGNLTAETPLMLMAGEDGALLELTMTDPTHMLTASAVVLAEETEVLECHPKLTVDVQAGKTVIRGDLAGANGRPFGVLLRKKA